MHLEPPARADLLLRGRDLLLGLGSELNQAHPPLALGGSRPLPELFAAAGIRFAMEDMTEIRLLVLRTP